jgi:hypothetical protein
MNLLPARGFAQSRARTLLAAWNSANLERLETALDANLYHVDLLLPAIEREKMELISEVVNAIRGWIVRSTSETELQAALLLLRHVACQEQVYTPVERTHGMVLAGSRSI